MARLVLSPEAARDLERARDWYDLRTPGHGNIFADCAAKSLDSVAQNPELYGVVWGGVRAATVHRHPYLIYYRITPHSVEVLGVLHARRDLDRLLDRLK